MERVYRTLVLKFPLELTEKAVQFLKVQKEFRRWALQWAKSGGRAPLPQQNPLKHFAKRFIHVAKALDWLAGVKKNDTPRRMRPPLVFDAQLRLSNERDESMGVFVDLPKKEVRIRKWSGQRGSTIVLPLSESAVMWILERVREGGRLALAAAWVGNSRRNRTTAFYVALVFRREITPIQPRRLLVIDFNALHNGVVYAVVEESRILRRDVLRPNASKLIYLQRKAAELDASCVSSPCACRQARAVKSRIWRLLRQWENEAAKRIIKLALQYKAAIVADVPDDESIRQLKEGNYGAERKIFLNFGRLKRRLKGLAGWYGIPLREERLYSTICPTCGAKMEEAPERRVKCKCGFETHRDEVPALWAQRRFKELTQPPSFSAAPAFATAAA